MSNLSGIVDSLESRVVKLLQEYENLKRLNTKLKDEITILKSQIFYPTPEIYLIKMSI